MVTFGTITPKTFGPAELELVRGKVRAVTRGGERKARPLPSDAAEEVESRVLLAIAEELAKAPMDHDRLGARAHVHAKRALAAVREEGDRDSEVVRASVTPIAETRTAHEERLIKIGVALRDSDGSITGAARVLGITKQAVSKAIKDFPELSKVRSKAKAA